MRKTDDFDIFLKSRFQKTNSNPEDDGFTEKVISNLPALKPVSIKRNLILFLSGLTSVLVFLFSNGYKAVLESLVDIFYYAGQLVKPSGISILVISVFIGIFVYISTLQYNKSSV